MKAHHVIASVALAAVASTTPATAQDRGSPRTRDYVQAAGQSDALEIAEARTALAESRDPKVRDYAERMIRDHGKTGAVLVAATRAEGLGSGHVDHSQKMTVAARATAEKKAVGQRS